MEEVVQHPHQIVKPTSFVYLLLDVQWWIWKLYWNFDSCICPNIWFDNLTLDYFEKKYNRQFEALTTTNNKFCSLKAIVEIKHMQFWNKGIIEPFFENTNVCYKL